jgi:uncharacterized RDD family membrane protein YckC
VALPLVGLLSSRSGDRTGFAVLIATIVYGVFYLRMLSRGTTPGKWMVGEQVVNKHDGGFPGLGKMFVREVPGKGISALALGIGFFWAIFDPDGQAWHDKIAGTVVVKKGADVEVTSPSETREPRFAMAYADTVTSRPATERFCSNCGGKNPTASNFCGHCGAHL